MALLSSHNLITAAEVGIVSISLLYATVSGAEFLKTRFVLVRQESQVVEMS